jgi:hypothetical protein
MGATHRSGEDARESYKEIGKRYKEIWGVRSMGGTEISRKDTESPREVQEI